MPIFDQECLLSDAQAVTADARSSNVMDMRAPGSWVHGNAVVDDKGMSCIPLAVQVVEDFNNLTSLTINVQTDDDPNFGSPKTVYSETIPLADLVAGKKLAIRKVPHNTEERYLSLQYDVTGTAPTTGKITAALGTELGAPFGGSR